MKPLSYLSLLLLPCLALVACTGLKQTPPPSMAPTVVVPPRAKPVDLSPARVTNRQAVEGNRQVQGELRKAKEVNSLLSRNLADAWQRGSASQEELLVMQGQVEELEGSLAEAFAVNLETGRKLELVGGDLSGAMEGLGAMAYSNEVMAKTIEDQNLKIEALTENSQTIAGERSKAAVEAASAKSYKAMLFWIFGGVLLVVIIVVLIRSVKPF